jgi:hypothetical protein
VEALAEELEGDYIYSVKGVVEEEEGHKNSFVYKVEEEEEHKNYFVYKAEEVEEHKNSFVYKAEEEAYKY